MTATQIKPHLVINCAVTQILGYYDTFEEAETAAAEYGNCSFPYTPTDAERERLTTGKTGTFHNTTGQLPSRDGQPITVLSWDAPVQMYEVRFADGVETWAHPRELTITTEEADR